jgi:hypothetical protein
VKVAGIRQGLQQGFGGVVFHHLGLREGDGGRAGCVAAEGDALGRRARDGAQGLRGLQDLRLAEVAPGAHAGHVHVAQVALRHGMGQRADGEEARRVA